MSDIYQFSQSSLPLLDRCINIASQPDAKWMRLFKAEARENILEPVEDSTSTEGCQAELPGIEAQIELAEQISRQEEEVTVEKFRLLLESKPSELKCLTEPCVNDNILLSLGEKLTLACMENIFIDLFNSTDVDTSFVTKLLINFFPAYTKKQHSCVPLDLLLKAYKTYPDSVVPLTESLCMDTTIPSKILEQFFMSIDEHTKSQFLQGLAYRDLTSEAFLHHLNTISCLYKYSQKTVEVQNFIFNCLMKCSELCRDDKNYGRFMLTFLQSVRDSNAALNKSLLEKLINYHETPFKKPCLSIFNTLDKE